MNSNKSPFAWSEDAQPGDLPGGGNIYAKETKPACSNHPWAHKCELVDGNYTCAHAIAFYKRQEDDESYSDSIASRRYEDAAYGDE